MTLFKQPILCLLLFASALQAEESSRSFRYAVDSEFIYTDSLNGWGVDAPRDPQAELGPLADYDRTLGLKRFRVDLGWEYLHSSGLYATLRPDATLDLTPDSGDDDHPRDYDSRSGKPYRLARRIYLLDSYYAEARMGPSFRAAFGVWSTLAERVTSYESSLEFGLLTKLLEGFSAVNFQWAALSQEVVSTKPLQSSGYVFDLFITQSRDDRGETRRADDSSFDTAPASDPYYGFAIRAVRKDKGTNRFGILAGVLDGADESTDEDTSETLREKRNEVYAQLFNITHLDFSVLPTTIALDVRYAKEKWKDSANDSRTQTSASLTFSIDLYREHWLLAGVHTGTSQPINGQEDRGYQIDLGYRHPVKQGMEVSLQATEEYRRSHVDGGSSRAGFASASENQSHLSRFALQLDYQFQSY